MTGFLIKIRFSYFFTTTNTYFRVEICGAEWEAFHSVIWLTKCLDGRLWAVCKNFHVTEYCLSLDSDTCDLTLYILAMIWVRGDLENEADWKLLSELEISSMFLKGLLPITFLNLQYIVHFSTNAFQSIKDIVEHSFQIWLVSPRGTSIFNL